MALSLGCSEEVAGTPPANGDQGPMGDGGAPDFQMPDSFVEIAPRDCNAYDFQGTSFNCSLLDRCDPNADLLYRLACCDCDPAVYCNPDPSCQPPEDEPPPPDPPPPPPNEPAVESCMMCHNGARERNDYSGQGMSNPHPFPGAELIRCTQCHGGDAAGQGPIGSHVPAPPSIRGDQLLIQDPIAYFNRLTLAGIDKLEPAVYTAPETGDRQWTNLDYLQFVNPGDLRVVAEGRGCGADGCHFNQHGQWVPRSVLAGSIGIFSGNRFAGGADNRIAENRGRNKDGDSLADVAPRAFDNPAYSENNRAVGEVGRIVEQREVADFNGTMRDNAVYDANNLANFLDNTDPSRPNRIRYNSPLDELWDEMTSITCGDCHLYSAGANNRYADFRSSGCTACHMQYSLDGRSRSTDRNVNKFEPANPDAIAAPERPHIEAHQIRNVAKILPGGYFLRGISDEACVGCHQGSNRTVLQYWGIRLDQNADLTNGFQYPANPADNNGTFVDTQNDQRLYPAAVNNNTFNGRNFTQYILEEDYDADGRDDTPPDVHYEAGMGCIDCHGSRDLHGGTADDPTSGKIQSRQDQATAIRCENCHGTVENYAQTKDCVTYQGQPARCAVDRLGNPLRHVTMDPAGNVWLVSRLSTQRLYVPQTRDTVVNNNKTHPLQPNRFLYNPKASYAMGRADGSPQTGTGPQQADPIAARVRNRVNFSHLDRMDCASCHASWTNNCIGCHLKNQYDVNPANYFASNITGKRTLLFQANADFVYQTPIPMYLGVNSHGKLTQISPAEKFFYRYQDLNGNESAVLAFSDRLGEGNNPNNAGRNAFPAMQMNQMAPHSIRGAVNGEYEGPRYCVSCHLNTDQLNNFGDEYADFLDDYGNNNFNNLDFNLLQAHIGFNPGNQLNSPFFVHMATGRGTGLFLFDQNGCPVNPLDENPNRQNCGGNAPADIFNVNNVVYDLDRFVEFNGINNSGSTHPMQDPGNPNLVRRINGTNAEMAGPMPGDMVQLLSDPNVGLVLDSWIDADGNAQGGAANFIQ
ncbi:MAG: hypothetical protein KC549_02525 [Myxococcales bacterium]|nr:hypothetical protein [Myxococcales bacterium]